MAVSSFGVFSLVSPHPNPKFSRNLLKPHVLTNPPPVRYDTRIRLPVKKLSSVIAYSSQDRKEKTVFWREKIAAIVLGSLIFIGSWKGRQVVLAQPVQIEESEEKRDDNLGGRSEGESEEEVMCAKLLEGNPRDVEALKKIVMMKRGKCDEAVEYVERLIELQPNKMEWRFLQAFCYEMMGNLSKAKRLYKCILKQEPLLLRALHGLAMVMHKNHEGAAVFKMLERALDVAHQKKRVNEARNIQILIALMHVTKGNMEQALEKLQALIHENPRDFRPYLCQGVVYSLLEKRKEADENFEMYRSLVPQEFPRRGFLDDVVLAARLNRSAASILINLGSY